jgi:hypothetical protein
MHRYRHSVWRSFPVTLLALSVARAEPVLQIEEPSDVQEWPLVSAELARSRGALSDLVIPESRDWRRIRLRKGAGLEMRHEISLGERDIVLGVKGPLMKKKRLGLAFELRF